MAAFQVITEVGQLPVRVTEIVVPRFTRKSQAAILDLGMSGGSVEPESKGDSRQRMRHDSLFISSGDAWRGRHRLRGATARKTVSSWFLVLAFPDEARMCSPNSSDKG